MVSASERCGCISATAAPNGRVGGAKQAERHAGYRGKGEQDDEDEQNERRGRKRGFENNVFRSKTRFVER